ncbi:uncharacterized protein M6B38_151475 [Iris pallida]|uniref:DUF641 domain-containing protein n=1 Tax=Iris pallida TaxID=29817 RepID=A0AAX6F7E4_IRIPA|nr:uncharacterized protein M6B38_151475 [Iris pallida]
MESSAPATSSFGSLARNITRILRFRRSATARSNLDNTLYKLRPSKTVEEYPSALSAPLDYSGDKVEDEKQQQQQQQPEPASNNREAMESLLANLFASVSAVKAAYAEMQVAQSPYDPETIQSSDQAVVSELKRLSELKQSYLKNQLSPLPSPPAAAQVQEHRNLLKTYKITFKKLESDIQTKVTEIIHLQSQLRESDHRNRSLESRLHPGRTLSRLDRLHLSSLDPDHFLTLVQYAVRSIRSFAKLMMRKMESAGWDLDAAAASIQPDVHRRPDHLAFALESFVCRTMFSGFQDRDFGLSSLEDLSSWEQQQFFVEFNDSKSVNLEQFLACPKGISSRLGEFCRAKYLSLVHPKMEASFFGDLGQRELMSSGRGFPETEFFSAFAEMGRRVWLTHCLFFSYGREMEASIFQMRRGCRFSEVYMESVAEGGEACGDGAGPPTVGFTVVPGFIVGKAVVQCKVYISGEAASVWAS